MLFGLLYKKSDLNELFYFKTIKTITNTFLL